MKEIYRELGRLMTKDEWYKQLFDKLGSSRFRSRFHLTQKDIGYINEKGLDFENFRSRMFGGVL